MEVLEGYRHCPGPLKGAALAIGNLDGVHRGHQAVLQAALEAAQAAGAPAGVMTFEPHPRQFFRPDVPLFRLTPEPVKLELFAALGLDLAAVLRFDAELASLGAEAFVREILVDGLGVSHVVTGENFRFGKGRGGDPGVLRELGEKHGFAVTTLAPQGAGGDAFSSSAVRARLAEGDPRGAAEILGYWWRVVGTVTGGDRRGHGLGFPTANIAAPPGFGLKHGIYAARVQVGEASHRGAAYLGTRPSFGAGEAAIETFLFDFSGDLYGRDIEIEIIDFLRGDATFESDDALKAQMRSDCEKAAAILDALERDDPVLRFPLGRALAG